MEAPRRRNKPCSSPRSKHHLNKEHLYGEASRYSDTNQRFLRRAAAAARRHSCAVPASFFPGPLSARAATPVLLQPHSSGAPPPRLRSGGWRGWRQWLLWFCPSLFARQKGSSARQEGPAERLRPCCRPLQRWHYTRAWTILLLWWCTRGPEKGQACYAPPSLPPSLAAR